MSKKIEFEDINVIEEEYKYHIHKLLGFYDLETNSYIYISEINVTPKVDTDEKFFFINDSHNMISNKNIDTIKNSVILYLSLRIRDPRIIIDNPDRYYRNNDEFKIGIKYEIYPYQSQEKDQILKGGAYRLQCVFNQPVQINFIMIFSEPVISFFDNQIIRLTFEYIGTLGLSRADEDRLILRILRNLDPNGLIKFNYNTTALPACNDYIRREIGIIIGHLDPTSEFRQTLNTYYTQNIYFNPDFRNIVMNNHIVHNLYVHNCFGDLADLNRLKNMLNGDDFLKGQFVHGYLHVLDSLNMYNPDYPTLPGNQNQFTTYYVNLVDARNTLINSTMTSTNIICFEHLLTRNQLNFLKKTADNINFFVRNGEINRYIMRDGLVNDQKTRHYYRPSQPEDQILPYRNAYVPVDQQIETPNRPIPYYLIQNTPTEIEKRKLCKVIIKAYIDELGATPDGNVRINNDVLNSVIDRVNSIFRIHRGAAIMPLRNYTIDDLIKCVRYLLYTQ